MATVGDKYISVARNVHEAHDLVRLQRAKEMAGSHAWSSSYYALGV